MGFATQFLVGLFGLLALPTGAVIHPTDKAGLAQFYSGLESTGTLSWDVNADLCHKGTAGQRSSSLFPTVVCDSSSPQRVTQLHLARFGLTGTLSTALNQLSSLNSLILEDNQLHGTLDSLNIPSLLHLNLATNSFSGTIPSVFGSFANMIMLVLSNNQLVGPVPSQLGNLKKLLTLDLSNNTFSSGIPTQFGGMTELRILSIHDAQLTGTIPTQLGDLSNLLHLLLGNNELSGPVPTELGSLGSLFRLELFNNRLSGSIPTQLGSLSDLAEMKISSNSLSGEVPETLSGLVNMDTLDFSGNQFSGNLPSFFDQLTYLTTLNLGSNNFSGAIPDAIPSLGNLRNLNLAHNELTGTIPQGWIRFLKNLNLGASSNRFCPTEDYSAWSTNSDYVSVSCEACSPLQCQQGECRYANSQYTCLCDPGYTGTLCDVRTVCPNVTEGSAEWSGLGATTVVSSCEAGYSGTPSRDCLSEGVWGPIQNPCVRNTCVALTEQLAVWPLSNSLTTVTGTCETGYSGSIQRDCLVDGSWGAITGVCTRNVCPAVTESFVSWPATNSLTTSVQSCPAGYTGSPSRYCEANGSWGTISNPCVRNTCPAVTEGNGQWPVSNSMTQVNITCQSGYTGSLSRLCDQNGQWQAYTGTCTRIMCSNVTEASATWPVSQSLTNVTGTCVSGYSGSVYRTCQADGTWGSVTGACVVYQCLAQVYGRASWPNTDRGAYGTGVCETGYTGTPKRLCQTNGIWSANVQFVCQRLVCPKVTESVYFNGTAPFITFGATNSLTYFRPACPTGFTGTPTRYCDGNGAWGPTVGSCVAA